MRKNEEASTSIGWCRPVVPCRPVHSTFSLYWRNVDKKQSFPFGGFLRRCGMREAMPSFTWIADGRHRSYHSFSVHKCSKRERSRVTMVVLVEFLLGYGHHPWAKPIYVCFFFARHKLIFFNTVSPAFRSCAFFQSGMLTCEQLYSNLASSYVLI